MTSDAEVHAAIGSLEASRRGKDPAAARTAMFGLGNSGRPAAVAPLLDVLEDTEEEPAMRAFAAASIGTLGRPEALDRLLAVAELDRSNLQFPAFEAIGKLRDVRAVPALVAMLEDEDRDRRYAVVGALERLDCVETRQALDRARKDPRWSVRLRARGARRRLSSS